MLDPQALPELRKEYRLRGLSEGEAADEPFAQFPAGLPTAPGGVGCWNRPR